MDKPFRVFGSPVESFWQKVKKEEECWVWTGSLGGSGYGQQRIEGKLVYAHRFSYEIHVGPIPEGMQVDHVCWTPTCVRPDHLRLATRTENQQNRKGASAVSRSGIRGVFWDESQKVWRAEAWLNGSAHRLGRFSSPAEAEEAVVAWRRENMPYSEMDKRKEIA